MDKYYNSGNGTLSKVSINKALSRAIRLRPYILHYVNSKKLKG